MVSFESDYNNGVQPEILHRLFDTNDEQTSGYGNDPYCEQAKEKIRHACRRDGAGRRSCCKGPLRQALKAGAGKSS